MDKKLSILLVEDDQATCNEFVKYIEALDDITLVGVTNNSIDTINYIKDFLPDAIILELEFHKGSGNSLMMLQEIKNLDLNVPPYILINTNNSSPITYKAARQLGADFIISKSQVDYSAKSVVDFLRIMKPVIASRTFFSIVPHCATNRPEIIDKIIRSKISSELDYIGINPKAIGYQYLIEAIQIIINQPMQKLCNVIGKKHGKTEFSVERAMQNAINRAWRTFDINDLSKHYTARISSERGVPTITEFVYYYANKIKNKY